MPIFLFEAIKSEFILFAMCFYATVKYEFILFVILIIVIFRLLLSS
jgi:hypothetical protein